MNYMLASSVEQIAYEWQKYQGYTVRPLPSTTAYYEKLINTFNHQHHFLMYGGTPEIRNIFQKLNLDVTLVDRSEEIVHAMGQLTKAKVSIAKNEYLIKIDWLELASLNHQFDLIIGDDAINMVMWENFERFLHNTAYVLRQNGLFICHLLVKPDDYYIEKNFYEILHEYKIGLIKSQYDLASRLNFICFDKNSYAMGWQQTIEKIGYQTLNQLKPDFDFIETFKFCNSRFYCPPTHQFEKLISKYFIIQEIFYPHEHEYCWFEPVYVLSKK